MYKGFKKEKSVLKSFDDTNDDHPHTRISECHGPALSCIQLQGKALM